MLPAHVTSSRGEAADGRQRARDLFGTRGRARARSQHLIDSLPHDRGVGSLPAARLSVDPGDLTMCELDLFPLHTSMMAYEPGGNEPHFGVGARARLRTAVAGMLPIYSIR